ncbi:MAG: sensor histidine kinase [Actinomycetota bacterium]
MDIKTGFRLILVTGVAIIAATIAALAISQHTFFADTRRNDQLDRIATEGTQLIQLTYEILLYGEARATMQWQRQYEEAAAALAELGSPDDPELRRIVDPLSIRFVQLRPLQQRLGEARAQQAGSQVLPILASQLFQDTIQFQASVRELKAHSDRAMTAAYRTSKNRQLAIFGTFGTLMAAYVITTLVLFRAVILRPLDRLGRTIEALRGGERARASVRADDEIGTVCQTFNTLLDEQDEARGRLEAQTRVLMRANADLESFAWVASHDLREPLRMVSTYITLIERRIGPGADAELREFMGYAVDGAKRMYALIGGLLEYARIGRDEGAPVPVPIGQVVGEALAMLSEPVAAASAAVEIQPDLPVIQGNRSELLRLFTHLIDNAVKFRRPDHCPRISVTCTAQADQWWFVVQDDGIGIDPQYHDKVFAMFQRVAGAGDYGGTGVGLAVCKKIVENHGGRIWIDSASGLGCSVFVALPKGE